MELNRNIDESIQKFEEAMDDDFNTPAAIGVIFELIAATNRFFAADSHRTRNIGPPSVSVLGRVRSTVVTLCGVLGLDAVGESMPSADKSLVDDLMKLMIQIRKDARERKNWATADTIRDGLADLGIKLEDTRDDTIWKIEK